MPTVKKRFYGTGRRKTAVARLYLSPGTGEFTVNEQALDRTFPSETLRMIIMQPLEITGNMEKFNVQVRVVGGGVSGQAEAVRHALSRALLALNQDYRKPLHRSGLLTRDAREVERKKYGHRKARKKSQYSKR